MELKSEKKIEIGLIMTESELYEIADDASLILKKQRAIKPGEIRDITYPFEQLLELLVKERSG